MKIIADIKRKRNEDGESNSELARQQRRVECGVFITPTLVFFIYKKY